ncbi:MAG: hypothetical protein LBK22_02550 [Tannerella sp.]|jgi:hypothetical protein|nr:hypothetical protein [Tannerella sp.]
MKSLLLSTFIALSLSIASCDGGDDSKSEQRITFDALQPRNLSEGSFELRATASSGLPVTFTVDDPATVSIAGTTATPLRAGTVTITASQPGNDDWYEAPGVSRTLTVSEDDPNKLNQFITFNLDADEWKSSDGDLTLDAHASSGLPVAFTVSNPDIAAVSGSTLTLHDGEYENVPVTIIASQAGNAEYNAAPPVSRSIRFTHDTH